MCKSTSFFFAVSHGDRPGGHQDIRQLSAPQAVHEVHWSVTQILTFWGGFVMVEWQEGFVFSFQENRSDPLFLFLFFLSCYLFSFS